MLAITHMFLFIMAFKMDILESSDSQNRGSGLLLYVMVVVVLSATSKIKLSTYVVYRDFNLALAVVPSNVSRKREIKVIAY